MKIIISPAKRFKKIDNGYLKTSTPFFINEAKYLICKLKTQNVLELTSLFKCSPKIASEAYSMYQNFMHPNNLYPAILAFNGIQYLAMAPNVFTYDEINYVKEHLYILSGLYGILRPYDEISPYRLDLDIKFKFDSYDSLYMYWGKKIYDYLVSDHDLIINLSSKEYSRLITPYITKDINFVDVFFYECINNQLVEKVVYLKEARGTMVRYLASINANKYEDITNFNLLGYQFSQKHSTKNKIVFIRKEKKHVRN